MIRNGVSIVTFRCSRGACGSRLEFAFLIQQGGIVTKIGQHPSIADLITPGIREYSHVLEPGQLSDWQRALGLRAHGIGAGSYVYLRRIIESLVEASARQAIGYCAISEADYRDARWPQRIKMLSDYLPSYLVDNANVYGVLSKGVHELSEEECNEYFDVVNTAIEIICEEKLAAKRSKERKEAGSQALNKILQRLNSKQD